MVLTLQKIKEVYRRFSDEVVIAEPSIANIPKVEYHLQKTIAKCG